MKGKFAHVMSFCRQVHVFIDQNITTPRHINISHAGGHYRIFLSTDIVKCFACGERGHTRKNCKKSTDVNTEDVEDSEATHDNPLKPPPVFILSKKSDPKNPLKTSKIHPPDPVTDDKPVTTTDEGGVRTPSSHSKTSTYSHVPSSPSSPLPTLQAHPLPPLQAHPLPAQNIPYPSQPLVALFPHHYLLHH